MNCSGNRSYRSYRSSARGVQPCPRHVFVHNFRVDRKKKKKKKNISKDIKAGLKALYKNIHRTRCVYHCIAYRMSSYRHRAFIGHCAIACRVSGTTVLNKKRTGQTPKYLQYVTFFFTRRHNRMVSGISRLPCHALPCPVMASRPSSPSQREPRLRPSRRPQRPSSYAPRREPRRPVQKQKANAKKQPMKRRREEEQKKGTSKSRVVFVFMFR